MMVLRSPRDGSSDEVAHRVGEPIANLLGAYLPATCRL
jgi:hypothetical protein